MFRRFQVKFTSPSDASVLIQSIQGHCICTPARGNENEKPASMPPPSVVPTSACTPLIPSTTTSQRMTRGEPMIPSHERSLDNTMSHSHIYLSIQQTVSSAVFGADSGPVHIKRFLLPPHSFSHVNSRPGGWREEQRSSLMKLS